MTETKECGADTKEQVRFFANQVEARIIDGAGVLLGEDERLWLAGLVEERGINLKVLGEKVERKNGEKAGTLTTQTANLEKALGGRENMITLVQNIFDRLTKEKTSESADFVATYLKNHTEDDGLVIFKETDGDAMRTKLEAIISVTHRLFKVLGAPSEEKSLSLQADEFTAKHLRERVIRRWEKNKDVKLNPTPKVPRIDEKVIRSLPVGGIEAIFETLIG